MHQRFYKKSGIVTSSIARDFLATDVGSKIPSVAEFAARFSVSRGIVQESLAFLQDNHAVDIRKEGARGTFLDAVHPGQLQRFTGWDTITGTMPLPMNRRFMSLATALNAEIENLPVPCHFAYISGAQRRAESVLRGTYDFSISSLTSARKLAEENESFEEPMVLDDCLYSGAYFLYFTSNRFPEATEIPDGARVAIDPLSTDQFTLTYQLCEGKQVEYVETPSIGIWELLTKQTVDCVVFRQDDVLDDYPGVRRRSLNVPGYTDETTMTPAILISKQNYVMLRFLKKNLRIDNICTVQREVLSGQRELKLY